MNQLASRTGSAWMKTLWIRFPTVGSHVLRVCRTSAVVQVKPTPRMLSSSSRAQEARSRKDCGQPDSVVAVSRTGRGDGPVRVC